MITVFGSIGLDQVGKVRRLPLPGETVLGDAFTTAPGGKGANQALAARRAGASVKFVGAVGDDHLATQATVLLRGADVDLSGVKISLGQTAVAMIFVEDNGENRIAVFPGASATLTAADAQACLRDLVPGNVVLLQQEIPQEATDHALDIARASGLLSVLNIAPYLDTTGDLAHKASILVANEVEFALLSGSRAVDLDVAMADWARHHSQTIIVTLGEKGARAVSAQGQRIVVSALPIAPVDTVGAGDTFCGYLAAGLDAGMTLSASMSRAAVAASLACLRFGAQPAIPQLTDVEAYLGRRASTLELKRSI